MPPTPEPAPARATLRAATLLALSVALAVAGCLGDTSGPRPLRRVAFAIAPVFSVRSVASVAFDRVRVTLTRSEGVALDTTVDFPATADSLVLSLSVPITGASETFLLNLAMIDAAGDTVYRGGPVPVTVTSLPGGTPIVVPVRYSGAGADADSVRISPRTASVIVGDSLTLVATAYDSSGAPIPGTPVAWRSLDSTIARLRSDTSGKVLALVPGVARIVASIPTGQADTARLTVQLVGVAASLAFTTQPPAGVTPLAPFTVVVTARDSSGNTAAGFTGAVTVAIANNPAAGTLAGTVTQNAVAGVATFSGLSIDNIGTGYTLSATATALPAATSAAFNVLAAANVDAWINTAGGNWSNASNWSKDAVPTATDTVTISQSGTYTVNLDVNGTYGFLTVGAPSGTQTLAIAANTLTAGNGVFTSHGVLSLSGTGTLNVTGALVVGGPMTWSGGGISIASGLLTLSGGAGASFGGTAAVTGSGALDFAGGTFALTANTTVSGAGTVAVTGGTLQPNGHTFADSGSFATAGTGVLKMTQAADTLVVAGTATFGGGSTTGLLTNGTISVGGSFVQGAGAADAFAPSGAEVVRLVGAAGVTQTVSFLNPTTSFFDSLFVDRGTATRGPVQLLTNVRVNRGVTLQNATDVTGPTARLIVAGGTLHTVSGNAGPTLTNLALELSAAPALGLLPDSVSPDTVVYNGAVANLPVASGLFYKSVRVNTSGTLASPGNVAYAGDLIVSSGTYAMDSAVDSVAGFFRTEGTGALEMTGVSAAPTLAVTDSAVFAGGASSALTGGDLRLHGNFVERGTGEQFAASGTHRVQLARAGPARTASATQTITFADSVGSFFNVLELDRPVVDTVRLLSNVLVNDSAIVNDSTVLASTTNEALKTPAAGVVRVHEAGVLRPSRVEMGTFVVDTDFTGATGRISPDTAVFLSGVIVNGSGTINSASPAYDWQSVRVNGGTLTSTGTVYHGHLVVSGTGTYYPQSGTDSVYGFFRTEGSGILLQNNIEGGTVVVQDSAVFGGGDETGNLSGGFLYVGGDFIQRGGATTFQAGGTSHYVVFDGATTQTVTFANPGPAASTFGNLAIERYLGEVAQPAGITLGSDIYVAGLLQDGSATNVVDSIAGSGHTVTALGLYTQLDFVMNDAPLVTESADLYASGITFNNMPAGAVQWTMNLPDSATVASGQLSGVTFNTTPAGSGLYFAALLSSPGSASVVVGTPVFPTAATLNGGALYHNQNGNGIVTITWGGTLLNDQQ